MVAAPVITLHVPTPLTGLLPDIVVTVTLHKFWSEPAAAVVGGRATAIATSLVLGVHPPLLIVQRKVAVLPIESPVMAVE